MRSDRRRIVQAFTRDREREWHQPDWKQVIGPRSRR